MSDPKQPITQLRTIASSGHRGRRKTSPDEELSGFWERVDKNGPIPEHRPDLGPCWVWLGARGSHDNYGRFYNRHGKNVLAHRFAYAVSVCGILPVVTLDHICRNTLCVNYNHLRPMASGDNAKIGNAPNFVSVRTNRCYKGHPLDDENTYTAPDGERQCRQCRRAARNRFREMNGR
jgi:hypothetical protein